MKNDNNILDEFLRDSVEQTQFYFKESDWEKMSAMLDEEDKQKKRPIFWRGFSIFMGLLLLSISAYLWSNKKSKSADIKPQQKVSLSSQALPSVKQDTASDSLFENENQNQTSAIAKNKPLQSNTVVSQNQDIQTASNQVSSTQNSNQIARQSSKQNESGPAKTKSKKLETKSVVAKDVATNHAIDPRTEDAGTDKQNSIDISKTAQANEDQDANDIQAPSVKLNEKKKLQKSKPKVNTKDFTRKANRKNTNTAATFKQKNEPNTIDSALQSDSKSQTNSAHDATRVNNKPNGTVQVNGKIMQKPDTLTYKGQAAIDAARTNPRYVAGLANYIPERIDQVTVLTYKPTPVESNTDTKVNKQKQQEPTPNTTENKSFIPRPFNWFLSAGAFFNKGFIGNVTSPIQWGLSPYVGLGLSKPFSDRLTLATQVGFTYFNGLNVSEKSSIVQYSFGVDSNNTIVTHKRLLQTYLPISLYYQIQKNNYLFGLIGASYAFDVSSEVENTKNSSNKTQNGYRSGFNQFDFFAGGGYAYRLSNQFMLQTSFQQGFIDMTKNQYFKNTNNMQTRIQIGIKYFLKRNEN